MSAPRSYSPYPRSPNYGGYPLGQAEHFRRASSSRITYPSLRPDGQSSLTPSLLLSNANPLRWALRWGPPSAAYLGGKLRPVRFHSCAWLCRTNAPGAKFAVGAAPCGRPQAFPLPGGRFPLSGGNGRRPKGVGIGAERSEADEGGLRNGRSSSMGRPVSGPYERKRHFQICRRGGYQPPVKPSPGGRCHAKRDG